MLGGLKDTFTSLMESAQKMGLKINQEKAMYIYIAGRTEKNPTRYQSENKSSKELTGLNTYDL